MEEFMLRAENSLSALAMWMVTKILTVVASENVPDFVGIASLSTFSLLLNPFSHHRLKVLGNLFSSSLPVFRVEWYGSVSVSHILTQFCLLSDKKLHC